MKGLGGLVTLFLPPPPPPESCDGIHFILESLRARSKIKMGYLQLLEDKWSGPTCECASCTACGIHTAQRLIGERGNHYPIIASQVGL